MQVIAAVNWPAKPRHRDCYGTEFSGLHNERPKDTINQMTGMVAKRLRYGALS